MLTTPLSNCRFIYWPTGNICKSQDQRPATLRNPKAKIPSLCFHHIKVWLARGQQQTDLARGGAK